MTAPIDEIRDAALDTYMQLIKEAAAAGAQIVALPELFTAPYFCRVTNARWYAAAETLSDGPTMTRLQPLATRLGIVLIVPLYEAAGNRRFNTAAVVDADGRLLGVYRK